MSISIFSILLSRSSFSTFSIFPSRSSFSIFLSRSFSTFSIFLFRSFSILFSRPFFFDLSSLLFSIYFSRYFILVIFDLTIYFNTKYNLIYDLNMKILITISFTCSARENCSLQTNCDRAYFNIFCFLSL